MTHQHTNRLRGGSCFTTSTHAASVFIRPRSVCVCVSVCVLKCVFRYRMQSNWMCAELSHAFTSTCSQSKILCPFIVCVCVSLSGCALPLSYRTAVYLTSSELFIPAEALAPTLVEGLLKKKTSDTSLNTQARTNTARQNYPAQAAINIYLSSSTSFLFHPAELISEAWWRNLQKMIERTR